MGDFPYRSAHIMTSSYNDLQAKKKYETEIADWIFGQAKLLS